MDKFYVEIQHYITTGTYHDMTKSCDRPDNRKSAIRKTAKQYIVKDGLLYYVGPKCIYMRLVVMSHEERKRVISECHSSPTTGVHYGVRRTQDKAVAGYYWSTLHKDIIEWVTSCDHCQLNKTIRTLPRAVHSIKVAPSLLLRPPKRSDTSRLVQVRRAWEVLGLDLIGPLPETSRENKYIVVMTDLYTKWVVAEPLRSTSESEVGAAIVKKLQTFGLVRKILTLQEKSYVDQLNEKIFAVLNVRHSVSMSHRPQKNRKVARTTKAVKQALWHYVNNQHDDWDLQLPNVIHDINTTPPAPGKRSPFFQMYNRVPLRPEELNSCPEGDALEVGNTDGEIESVIISDRLPPSLLLPRSNSSDDAPGNLQRMDQDDLEEGLYLPGGRLDRQLIRVAFHHDHYYWTSEPGKLGHEMG